MKLQDEHQNLMTNVLDNSDEPTQVKASCDDVNESEVAEVLEQLRFVNAHTQMCGASAAMETNLRAAFRQHAAQNNHTIAIIEANEIVDHDVNFNDSIVKELVVAQAGSSWNFGRHSAALFAVTLCVIASAVFAVKWQSGTSQLQSSNKTTAIEKSTGDFNDMSRQVEAIAANQNLSGADVEEPQAGIPFSAPTVKAKYVAPNKPRRKKLNVNKSASAGVTEEAAPREIATNFMPLEDARFTPFEGGQLVRVELPRSALLAMGLPVSAEQSGKPIKADVLLGNDGTAHAIRFVR